MSSRLLGAPSGRSAPGPFRIAAWSLRLHNGIEWELAGVLFGIGQFEEQPEQTALYGNLP